MILMTDAYELPTTLGFEPFLFKLRLKEIMSLAAIPQYFMHLLIRI